MSALLESLPPSAWALAAWVVLLTGISKAGFGGALGGVSVPLLALVVPAPVAAGTLLPVLDAIDWLGIGVYWKPFLREERQVLLPGAVVGVVLGSLSLGLLDPLWVQLVVGLIAIGLGIYRLRGKRAGSGTAGVAAGRFWSALAHAGGPPLFAYLSNRSLDPTRFVATASCFFFIVNLMKLPGDLAAGVLKPQLLLTSLILMPLVPVGVRTGVWLQSRLKPSVFERAFTWILLLSGIQLVASSLRQLWH